MIKTIIFLFIIMINFTGCLSIIDGLIGGNSNQSSSTNQVSNIERRITSKEVNVLENFGWDYRELQGLVFSINAKGDKNTNSAEVRRLALTRAATIARNKGYQAFTVLNQDTGIITETEKYTEYTTETYYRTEWVTRTQSREIPYTVRVPKSETRLVNVNYCILIILLIEEDEYEDVKNVFFTKNYQ